MVPPLLLLLFLSLLGNLWLFQMPSLLLKFQWNPARLVIKARGQRGKGKDKGKKLSAKAKDVAKMKEVEVGS